MKFYSEELDKLFDSEKELKEKEKEFSEKKAKEKAEKDKLAAARKERAQEIEQVRAQIKEIEELAQKKREELNDLLRAFNKDYGAYHVSLRADDFIDWFFSF